MSYIDNNGLIYLWSKIKAFVTNATTSKVDKVTGKQLSTNDYTTDEKNKLAGVAVNATKNIVDTALNASSTNAISNSATTTKFNVVESSITSLNSHMGNKSNPHNVTKAQIGLSNVDNTSDLNKPVSTAVDNALKSKFYLYDKKTNSSENLNEMLEVGYYQFKEGMSVSTLPSAISSPLENMLTVLITKRGEYTRGSDTYNLVIQEILYYGSSGYVIYRRANIATEGSQTLDSSWPEWAEFHNLTGSDLIKFKGISNNANYYVHPNNHPATIVTEDANHKFTTDAEKISWNSHVAGRSNPHVVTKAQVGLGNVDNTSDANKPISNATLLALEGKMKNVIFDAGSHDLNIFTDTGYFTFNDGCNMKNVPSSGAAMGNFDLLVYRSIGGYIVQELRLNDIQQYLRCKKNNIWGNWVTCANYTGDDKVKLDGIATGAQVNQSAFSTINWNNSVINAGNVSDVAYFNAEYGISLSTSRPDGKNRMIIGLTDATSSNHGAMSTSDKVKLDSFGAASTYALKSDIVGMYKYKGSVAAASNLPTTGQNTGDVYNITTASIYGAAGANVAWDGSKWDSLGGIFTITSMTNAEIDTICV